MQSGPIHKPASERAKILRLAVVSTGFSLLPTIYAAYASNSVALLADLLRCTVEFLAILISWLVLQKISRTDRAEYNFGFGKLEQLASFNVGLAMLLTAAIALFSSINRFISPQAVQGEIFGLVLALLSVLGNAYMWWKNAVIQGREPNSLVQSQARLFRAKTVASVILLGSLTLSNFSAESWFALYADPLGSLFIACFLIYSAHAVLSHSMGDLVDRAVDEALQTAVLRVLVQNDSLYMGYVGMQSRQSGERREIDITLEFDPKMSIKDVTRAANEIRAKIVSVIPRAELRILPLAYGG